MEDNNELTIYILQQLRQGVPEPTIRSVLAQNGWPQPLVDRAFTMVQQARPHAVEPPMVFAQQQIPASRQETELPTPAENPYPVLEGEKKREKRSRLRKLLTGLLVLLVLAAIGGAIYYFVFRDKPATPADTREETQSASIDDRRKEAVNRLASSLLEYYKKKGTYPTFAQINNPDFSKAEAGFDATAFRDPDWDAKKSACLGPNEKPSLAETRSEGCLTYRSTAVNGEDCDGEGKKCTRVVLTATLEDKKPFVVALDQNKREQ